MHPPLSLRASGPARVSSRGRRAINQSRAPAADPHPFTHVCARLEHRMRLGECAVIAFVEAATWLMHWQQPGAALNLLRRLDALVPGRSDVHRQLGKVLWRLGWYEVSIETSRAGQHPERSGIDCEHRVFSVLARDGMAAAFALAEEIGATRMQRLLLEAQAWLDTGEVDAESLQEWTETEPGRFPALIGDARGTLAELTVLADRVQWRVLMTELALPIYDKFRDDPWFVQFVQQVSPPAEMLQAIHLRIPDRFFTDDNFFVAPAG